jgi:Zn finger protein HypA/HybF involved in hydrogenase expression
MIAATTIEAPAASSARQSLQSAYEELGDRATVAQIAAKAGVDLEVAEEFIDEIIDADSEASDVGVPRGEEVGAWDDGKPMHMAQPGEPTDKLNRPVAKDLIPVFEDTAEFRALIVALGRCKSAIKNLAQRGSAAELDAQSAIGFLEEVQLHLESTTPYCVCPSCSGQKRHGLHRRKLCPTCRGLGFICAGGFARLHADLQAIANGYQREQNREQL